MRSFSPTFTEKKNARANVPVNLLELWLEGGQNILYFSDRDMTLEGIAYRGQILDWGTWGKGANRLVLANAGSPPLPEILKQMPPEGSLVKLYQWFEGLSAGEQVLLWVGKVSGGVTLSEETIELPVEPLEKSLHKILGRRISPSDYPFCPSINLGKLEPIVIGQVAASPAWLVDVGEQIAEIAIVGTAQAYVSTAKDSGQWGDAEKKEAIRRAVEAYKKLWSEKFGEVSESDVSIEHRLEAKLGQLKAEGALP